MIDAKKYLRQIEILDRRITAKVEERQNVLDMLLRITPVMRDTTSGGDAAGHDKMENGVVKLTAYEEEISADIDRLVELKREISEVIDLVENPKRRAVLRFRYINYKSFEQIAVDMDMSYRNICYIHGKALRDVSRILEEDNSGGKEKEDQPTESACVQGGC